LDNLEARQAEDASAPAGTEATYLQTEGKRQPDVIRETGASQLGQDADAPGKADLQATHYGVPERTESALAGIDKQAVWEVLRELYHVDVANMTPVQALVLLNELQVKLDTPRRASTDREHSR
jgi:hypothetical protein